MVLPAYSPTFFVFYDIVPQTAPTVTLTAGTPLFVRGDARVRMRVGQVVRGHLVFDVYAGNTLVLPKDSVVVGEVTSLAPDGVYRLTVQRCIMSTSICGGCRCLLNFEKDIPFLK